jgi:RND family efflux transporter MFP subunit
MSTNRPATILVLLPVLLALLHGAAACGKANGDSTAHAPQAQTKAPAKAPPPVVSVITVKPQHFSSQIEATGTALPARAGLLSASVPGRIQSIAVKRGERVRKGQVLLRLESSGFALQIQQAEAALAGAQVSQRTTEREVRRFSRLRKSDAVAGATLDKVQAQYDGAVAQRQMAAAALRQARKARRDATLCAPYAGVITMILKEVGEFAPAMPPTMLVRIVDSSSLQVQAFVPEKEAPFVKPGLEAQVRIDSADLVRKGQVVFVSDSIDPKVQSFEIRVHVDNADGAIKAGAFARLKLPRQRLDDALLIPKQAVARDKRDQPHVFTVHGGAVKQTSVTLGERTATHVLVRAGLTPEQTIVAAGIADLKHGQRVTPRRAGQGGR